MASVINGDVCVGCGACAEVCPVSAISDITDSDGESIMIINPDVCVDCGVCIGECPNGAIMTESEADQKWIDYNKSKASE